MSTEPSQEPSPMPPEAAPVVEAPAPVPAPEVTIAAQPAPTVADPHTIKIPKFSYEEVSIKDLKCEGNYELAAGGNGRMKVTKLIIKDQKAVQPTQRFWDSLMSRFGFGSSIFTYFSHAEVFERISMYSSSDKIRICVQETAMGPQPAPEGWMPRLLSVSHPGKPILYDDCAVRVLIRLDATNVEYRDGIILSKHSLRRPLDFNVGLDRFSTKLTLETPIDGYGRPTVYLAMRCEETQSDLTAYAKSFQSGIILGGKETAEHTLERAVESYSNEDGFSALKQRLESAQKSWASVHEIVRLTRLIWKLNNDDFNPDYVQSAYNQSASSLEKDKIRNDLLSNLHQIAGDLRALYSVAQLDSISEKRMRALPAKCKVYDIIRLSMELASKKLKTESGRKIHLYVGELVSAEYDLEESGTKFGSFDDFIDTKAKDRFKKSGEAALE